MWQNKRRKGVMFIISSPSGAGKTTLAKRLISEDFGIEYSVSCTTRAKRKGEVEGQDYFFITEGQFNDKRQNGDMLEYAEVFGNFYGSPSSAVYAKINAGQDILFDIDWQGAKQIKEKTGGDAVSIFILPPSLQELEARLRNRGLDKSEVIEQRMSLAQREISKAGNYDYVIINDNLENAYKNLQSIINSARLRVKNFT